MQALRDPNVLQAHCAGLRERPDLDTMFAPRPTGYAGADVALSIPLPSGDVLWVFGDTLMGTCSETERRFGGMPRNTAAIQHGGRTGADDIEWLFRADKAPEGDFFRLPEECGDSWFWPGTGLVLDGELFVLGYGVSNQKREHEALSFRLDGQWLMRVRDMRGHPLQWKIEASRFERISGDPWFCSGCAVDGGHLALMGFYHAGTGAEAALEGVVARVPLAELRARGGASIVEFRGAGEWTRIPGHIERTWSPGVSECTLLFDAPRRRWLATTYLAHRAEFFLVEAPRPEGPWSAPGPLFRLPHRGASDGAIGYAFRMHPHLARDQDEMVVSYLVNSLDPSALVRDPGIYYPRFASFPLDSI